MTALDNPVFNLHSGPSITHVNSIYDCEYSRGTLHIDEGGGMGGGGGGGGFK